MTTEEIVFPRDGVWSLTSVRTFERILEGETWGYPILRHPSREKEYDLTTYEATGANSPACISLVWPGSCRVTGLGKTTQSCLVGSEQVRAWALCVGHQHTLSCYMLVLAPAAKWYAPGYTSTFKGVHVSGTLLSGCSVSPIISRLSATAVGVTTPPASYFPALAYGHVAHVHLWVVIRTSTAEWLPHQASTWLSPCHNLGTLEKEAMPPITTLLWLFFIKPSINDDSSASFLFTSFQMGWPHINHLNQDTSKREIY